jgi:Rrf2 family transcriptional regulator, nitric oxide-sensitive transcriptional repressor
LQKQKIAVRLLSMPSWALFEGQSHEYRDSVLSRFCQSNIQCTFFTMRLALSTDYALRLLMLVGLEPNRLVTIEEVAERFGISKNHLMKVAYELGQAKYLETVRGRNGGLRLGKAPDQIVVGEVVRKMEPDFAVVECESPTGWLPIVPCCVLAFRYARSGSGFSSETRSVHPRGSASTEI